MIANKEMYIKDLDRLISQGDSLLFALGYELSPEKLMKLMKNHGDAAIESVKKLPAFNFGYQSWYSEANAIIRQLLPDRLADFTRHYEKPMPRKDITFENYRIEELLQGLVVKLFFALIVGKEAALPHFQQQLAILNAVKSRFESSLFDIRQTVQADLLDSEIAVAQELLKNGFIRSSGVVLEWS